MSSMTDREHRDRRERIATAAMQGILSCGLVERILYDDLATASVRAADALIAELDKPKEGGA